MTQEERWDYMYSAYIKFLHENKRRPSKYRPQEKKLVNWLKHSRKLKNKGLLLDSRKERFDNLLAEAEKFKRLNQHAYVNEMANDNDDNDE